MLYDTQGQFAKAQRLFERALATAEKALGPEHPDVATKVDNLARLYRAQGQYEKAEPLHAGDPGKCSGPRAPGSGLEPRGDWRSFAGPEANYRCPSSDGDEKEDKRGATVAHG
jgi:hypothetical protein